MQGKRYVASNMRLALKMVRDDLGPDAVILSNKQVPEGVELLTSVETISTTGSSLELDHVTTVSHQESVSDNPFVQDEEPAPRKPISHVASSSSRLEREVERMRRDARVRAKELASGLTEKYHDREGEYAETGFMDERIELDKKDNSLSTSNQMITAITTNKANAINEATNVDEHSDNVIQQDKPRSSTAEPIGDYCTEIVKNTELEQMRFEMQSMRDLLEQQLSSIAWGQYNQNNPEKASQWRRLKRIGIDANLANSLVDNINYDCESTDCWQTIMVNLSRRLPVMTDDIIANGGVFAFVGPTGAGKTTTIGKLAAQYVLKNGATSIALITTDTMRIAAQEQLRIVARILNIPIKVVDKNNTLDRVLHSLRHKSLVLIDTAGLNPSDKQLHRQLSAINELGQRVKSILVIPTTSHAQVIKSAFHSFKTDNLTACVLTKLDETSSLGESICLAIEKNLPIAYSTHGQNIPQDIAVADRVRLVKSAIKLAKHTDVNESVMAEEIVSLSRRG